MRSESEHLDQDLELEITTMHGLPHIKLCFHSQSQVAHQLELCLQGTVLLK